MDKWADLPLARGDKWRRLEDGEVVTIRKRIGRAVRYRFAGEGEMVTRIARFSRFYEPLR